jgi:predicted dehydrogenase
MAHALPTLRVAMIGQGSMGRAHSNAYHQAPHFFDLPYNLQRKVICGRDAARLQKMAEIWGWEETSTHWESVIERKDIDVIDIATPNFLHAPIAIEAARAGKIVLCEKPLANSVEEGTRVVDAARAVRNMVWFNYRRIPAVAFAKRLADEGHLGNIYHYRATYLQQWGNDPSRARAWKFDPSQAGSGVLGDLLSHVVDTALWLNREISEVLAMQHTFAPERAVDDATLIMVRFANGSIGSFEASRYAIGYLNHQTFEIHGERGMLRFDLEDLTRLHFFDATAPAHLRGARPIMVTGPDHPYSDNFWKPGHPTGYEHTFIAALADFVNALGADTPFHPDFEDGQRVQSILEAAEHSAKDGGWRTPRS